MFKYNEMIVIFGVFFVVQSFGLCQANQTEEIDKYIQIIQEGDVAQKILVAKEISKSGLKDSRIFNIIERELLHNFNKTSNSLEIDYVSWLCKALASSGKEKYKNTINTVLQGTNNFKIMNYARQSMDLFDEYIYRSNVINKTTEIVLAERNPEIVKLINMLKSRLMKIKRDAAKNIIRNKYSDPGLYRVVNEELLKGYKTASSNLTVDTMAWLCKALGNSGNIGHKDTLLKVINSGNPKLSKNARLSFEMIIKSNSTSVSHQINGGD